jgi:hypothetical protein
VSPGKLLAGSLWSSPLAAASAALAAGVLPARGVVAARDVLTAATALLAGGIAAAWDSRGSAEGLLTPPVGAGAVGVSPRESTGVTRTSWMRPVVPAPAGARAPAGSRGREIGPSGRTDARCPIAGAWCFEGCGLRRRARPAARTRPGSPERARVTRLGRLRGAALTSPTVVSQASARPAIPHAAPIGGLRCRRRASALASRGGNSRVHPPGPNGAGHGPHVRWCARACE